MRAIVQRVMQAKVTVDEEVISSIGKGICVLVGISRHDTKKDLEYLVRKILNLRVFDDDKDKRWCRSVMDSQLDVLCVSQFTLYSVLKGNKPDFHCSMGGDESKAFYMDFLDQMKKAYKPEKIFDGSFGAHMQVHIQNDGPVTITLESPAQLNEKAAREEKWKAKAKKPIAGDQKPAPPGDKTPGASAAPAVNVTSSNDMASATEDLRDTKLPS